jgi:hypothetical protein
MMSWPRSEAESHLTSVLFSDVLDMGFLTAWVALIGVLLAAGLGISAKLVHHPTISRVLMFGGCAMAALTLAATAGLFAQQVRIPRPPSEAPGPASGTAMTKEYVQMVGRMAYFWGWPIVNSYNRRTGMAKLSGPGLNGGNAHERSVISVNLRHPNFFA